jgi:hypothetical protein
MSPRGAALYTLPDELLLDIISSFACILSYEPQSSAFKDKEKEKARQCENGIRQRTLYSLCLTSQRLRRIAVPILYSSFHGSTTKHGSKLLQLFHRTISNSECGSSLGVRYADYLHSVENRFADYLGNSLYEDISYDTECMADEYFQLLANIVKSAPNLRHLSVVSLETEGVSFWRQILPEPDSTGTGVATTALRDLRSLSFQVHMDSNCFHPSSAWFQRICSTLTSVPKLTDLRASSVVSFPWSEPLRGTFENVQRLDITECVVHLDDVVELLEACEGLQHFTCEWAFLNCNANGPCDLYSGLWKHRATLRTLNLDMREVRFGDQFDKSRRLGTLQSFTALESLTLCETTLLGNTLPLIRVPYQVFTGRISELLPARLQNFTLLLLANQAMVPASRLDEVFSLWNFVDECKTGFPDLRYVSIVSNQMLSSPNAAKAFEDVNVHFQNVKEVSPPVFD